LAPDKLIAALKGADEVQLAVKGRKSGKDIPRPVWFALRRNEVLFLPVTGSQTQWYKNVLKNPRVGISVAGQTYGGRLDTITERSEVSEVVELFRKKYGVGDVKRYYPRLDVAARLPLA
jgi:hypothetical protein